MKCPFCRQTNTEIFNTRTTKFGSQTWRRRRCLGCHQSFTTYEAADLSFIRVTGPEPSRPTQRYSRSKLFSSLYAAFLDIPAKDSTIDAVTDTIEAKVLDLGRSEITSLEIAHIVLTTLKHFNTAAFLRYLTSHSDLTTPAQLKKELKKY